MRTDVQFVKAAEMTPAPYELNAIKLGDYVKVKAAKEGLMSERFWVKVFAVDGDDIDGFVWNELVYITQSV